jgi:Tol biopolymer transport system component
MSVACRRSRLDRPVFGALTIIVYPHYLGAYSRLEAFMLRRILLLMICCSLCGFAQSKHPFTFEDMMQLKRIGEPIVSPDGKWVAFSAVDVNLDANTKTSHLWIVPVSGGESRRLTPATGPGEDRIRFAPDGKHVLFESSRDGGSQIWLQKFDTSTGTLAGEPHQVTHLSTEASGAIWSPDGDGILFVSSVYPDCHDEPHRTYDQCNKEKDGEKANSKVKAKIFTELLYRHWTSYFDGKYSHLFLTSASCALRQENPPSTGTFPGGGSAFCGGTVDLTPGAHDVPPFSLGGQDQYSFSPDGKEIAYTSNIDEVQATSTNSDIFTITLPLGPRPWKSKKITTNPGSDSTPIYSPDGKYIAYRSQLRGGYESDRFRLMLYERATGKITDVSPNFDRWVDSMAWSPDSKTIYFTAENEGDAPIYKIDVTAEHPWPQELVAGFNDSPTPTSDGKALVFDRMSVAAPNEIYRALARLPDVVDNCGPVTADAVNGRQYSTADCMLSVAQPVTKLNDPVLSQVQMQPLETFWFEGAAKEKVQGFVVKPPNFDREQEVSG